MDNADRKHLATLLAEVAERADTAREAAKIFNDGVVASELLHLDASLSELKRFRDDWLGL